MDAETKAEWEKSKRVDAERMKAARELAKQSEPKANSTFFDLQKSRGFSRDPRMIMMSAERMANASILFAVLGTVFGFFSSVFAVVAQANNLGLAGAGIAMVFDAINAAGIGIAVITSVIALVCTLIFAWRTQYKIKPIIVTTTSALVLIAIYTIVDSLIKS